MADTRSMEKLDKWIRSRMRMVIWKRWKKVRTRFENLKRLGIRRKQAWMWANTRKGYWRIAHSPILTQSPTNEILKRTGYLGLMECYSVR